MNLHSLFKRNTIVFIVKGWKAAILMSNFVCRNWYVFKFLHVDKNNEKLICTLGNGNRYIPNIKAFSIDVLNIHSS